METRNNGFQHVEIRDLLTVIFKHKKKAIAVFFGIVLTATIGSFLITPIYESESSLMVKMGREHIYQSEVGTVNPSISFDQERVIQSEIQILSSLDLAKRVVESIGVESVYPELLETSPDNVSPLQASAQEMLTNLNASVVTDANVIRVSFQHENPEISTRVINLLVDFLLEKHLEIFSNPQTSFLEKQALTYQEQYYDSQAKLQKFKQEHGVSSLATEQTLLLEQRRNLDTSLKEIQNRRGGLVSKLSSLKTQIAQVSERVPLASVSERQNVIDQAKANLLELSLQEQKLSTRYRDSSRRLTDIRDEIAMIKSFIQQQETTLMDKVTTGKNPVFEQLEIEIHNSKSGLSSLLSQEREIQTQLKGLDARLVKFDQLKGELEKLQLKADGDQKNYVLYRERLEEARISKEMDQLKMANISVIQPATVPSNPIKPQKGLNILLSLIVGLVVSVTLAFLAEYMEGGYTRPEYVARDLELPILTNITYKT